MDNFREWLSDNLRYFMLGGAILILLLLIFFGFRVVSGMINGDSDTVSEQTEVTGSDVDETTDTTATPTPTEKPADPLEKDAHEEVDTLVASYYEALGKRDVATLSTLVDSLDPSEEARIENSQYIEGYSDIEVYTKKGMAEDTYVVFAKYKYNCTGISTPVPALSQMYVVKDGSDYKISSEAEDDAQIQAYVTELLKDEEVAKLISDTEAEYEAAQTADPALKEFLENLGTESNDSEDAETSEDTQGASQDAAETEETTGETTSEQETDPNVVTTNTDVYVHSGPGGSTGIIATAFEGEQFQKLGEDGYFVIVDYYGQTGYIYYEYVN